MSAPHEPTTLREWCEAVELYAAESIEHNDPDVADRPTTLDELTADLTLWIEHGGTVPLTPGWLRRRR